MKKILLVLMLLAAPVFASCALDSNEPCSAEHPKKVTRTNSQQNNTNKSYIENAPQHNYNSNCQFGICLPSRDNHKETVRKIK